MIDKILLLIKSILDYNMDDQYQNCFNEDSPPIGSSYITENKKITATYQIDDIIE
jgi:hypothetical protein